MDIKQALTWGIKLLTKAKINSATLDAEIILIFILDKTKEFIYTYPEIKLNKNQENKFKKLIKKRATHFPIAYILNNKEFFHLNFYVNQNVLTPRPETELLVEQTLAEIKKLNSKNKTTLNLAEIGTGSGCISIAIAKNSKVKILATDICKKALNVANKNAKTHNVQSQIKFLQGSLLEPLLTQTIKQNKLAVMTSRDLSLQQNKKIDILIANLPYIELDYKKKLKTSAEKSINFEPQKALYSGADGTDDYAKLFAQVKLLETKPKIILIEIGHSQVATLTKIIQQNLPQAKIGIVKDLAGKNRVLEINLQK